MKTSAIASLLFAATALAAPVELDRRDTYTTVKFEYVTVTETVWDDAAPTSVAGGAFYENPHKGQDGYGKPGKPTQTPQDPVAPTSAAPLPVVTPTSPSTPSSAAVSVPPPADPTYPPQQPSTTEPPVVPTPTPTPTYAPEPAPTSAAPQPTQPSNPGSGEIHSGGSLTWHNFGGGTGACSAKPIRDTDMAVALDINMFSPVDVWEQNDENGNGIQENMQYWCDKQIEITDFETGKTARATIMDKCEACTNGGLDATKALYEALGRTIANGDRTNSISWKLVG